VFEMPAAKAVSKIETVPLSKIDANPCRLLKKYPFIASKLEALERSMEQDDIGCWEGIIARAAEDRYEIAFGHHRIQAAKNIGLKSIPLIIRPLNDREMIQFMGRENLDDYAASFAVLLETWEAAEKFCSSANRGIKSQPIEIARLLGWVKPHTKDGIAQLTHTARACYAASKMIASGHLEREALQGLSVDAAEQIVERAANRLEHLDKLAAEQKRPHAEVERAKRHVANAVKDTAKEVREGRVASRDIRSRVDVNAYVRTQKAKKVSPLFDSFGRALADSLSKMVKEDSAAQRLDAIEDALGKIELEADHQIVARILFELERLGERVEKRHSRLSKKPAKATVVALKLLKNEG
jgi:ParB family chromosome partitioning protein